MFIWTRAVFCVVRSMSVLHSIRTRKCTKLFTENITEYFAHAQAVCIRPLLGGEGPGNEASMQYDFLIIVIISSYMVHSWNVHMDSCCILCIKKYVSTPCVDVHVVSFCNLIGTARPRRWKSTTLPLDVTRLSPPPHF